jgi:isocitrate/isopropylmalate dehydrogenase
VTREYKIAVIGGDGIGPEVTHIALEAINRVTSGSGVTFKTATTQPAKPYPTLTWHLSKSTTRFCSARSVTQRFLLVCLSANCF